MRCDRCGKKTHHIYVTEDHEKVCKRSCNGEVKSSPRIFYVNPKEIAPSSKDVVPTTSIFQRVFCWSNPNIWPGNRPRLDSTVPRLSPCQAPGQIVVPGAFFPRPFQGLLAHLHPTNFPYHFTQHAFFPWKNFAITFIDTKGKKPVPWHPFLNFLYLVGTIAVFSLISNIF